MAMNCALSAGLHLPPELSSLTGRWISALGTLARAVMVRAPHGSTSPGRQSALFPFALLPNFYPAAFAVRASRHEGLVAARHVMSIGVPNIVVVLRKESSASPARNTNGTATPP